MADEDKAATDEPGAIPEPEARSLDDLSVDEIASAIQDRAAEPEEPAEPVEEEPETPSEPAAQEEARPSTIEDRIAQMESALEEERLLRSKAEARSQHIQYMLDSRAGEIGHLTKMLRQRESSNGDSEEPEETRPAAIPSEFQEALAEWREDKLRQVVTEEVGNVRKREAVFFDALEKLTAESRAEFDRLFEEKLVREAEVLGARQASESGNVKRVASITRAAYVSALADARIEFMPKIRAAKVAAQTASIKDKKLAAAAGAPGSRPAVRPRVVRNLEDLNADEIAREIMRREKHDIVI